MTPLQRMADPAEIRAAAAFLASSDSSFVSASESVTAALRSSVGQAGIMPE